MDGNLESFYRWYVRVVSLVEYDKSYFIVKNFFVEMLIIEFFVNNISLWELSDILFIEIIFL